MNWRRMDDSELTAYEVRDGSRWVPMPRCSLCGELVPFMHEHLVAEHGWADPGSVFGRIVMDRDAMMWACSGCGHEPLVTDITESPTMIHFVPRCSVCGLTFTNNGS